MWGNMQKFDITGLRCAPQCSPASTALRRSLCWPLTFPLCSQTFLTLLSEATAPVVESLLVVHILKGLKISQLSRAPPEPPSVPGAHVLFEEYWVEAGPAARPEADAPDQFVLTASVRRHLATLARAVLLRRHPILLQVCGPSQRAARAALCCPRVCSEDTFIPRTESAVFRGSLADVQHEITHRI